MFRKAKPFFLICESPLHVGTGTDLGIVDNPIQRERHTSFPKIEGSGLKGAIREVFEKQVSINDIDCLFGSENNSDRAGSVGFADARILLFPVKSAKGVFAWITCPMVLKKMETDFGLPGSDSTLTLSDMVDISNEQALFVAGSIKSSIIIGNQIILEEYAFEVDGYKFIVENQPLNEWLAKKIFPDIKSFWHDKLKSSLVVVSDYTFTDFVNLSTEVTTGIRINNATGVVADSALFTQEYLPSDSVMYSIALFSPEFTTNSTRKDENDIEKLFCDNLPSVIQIGGNATIGKGITRTQFVTIKKQ